MSIRCPICAAPNQATARFCLDCGEPLDAERLAASLGADAERPARSRAWWRGREAPMGAILLVVLIALAGLMTWQGTRDRQEAAYRRGLADVAAHRWEAAIRDLWVA